MPPPLLPLGLLAARPRPRASLAALLAIMVCLGAWSVWVCLGRSLRLRLAKKKEAAKEIHMPWGRLDARTLYQGTRPRLSLMTRVSYERGGGGKVRPCVR